MRRSFRDQQDKVLFSTIPVVEETAEKRPREKVPNHRDTKKKTPVTQAHSELKPEI